MVGLTLSHRGSSYGVCLGFFLLDVLDGPRDRRDERRRVGQGLFGQLELRNQHAGSIDNDQTIALIQ